MQCIESNDRSAYLCLAFPMDGELIVAFSLFISSSGFHSLAEAEFVKEKIVNSAATVSSSRQEILLKLFCLQLCAGVVVGLYSVVALT